MSIKLIASDLDGTIIDEYNKIASKNTDAIKQIKDKNIGFAISTGKIYSSVKNVCENFNASYGIFGNGIQVIDFKTGKEIYCSSLDKKEYEYLDITSSNTSKGNALNLLREYLRLSQDEVMAIGDNINDKDMLQNAGIGVAVANASEQLKQIASYITTSPVEDGGFAEAITKYLGEE